MMKVWSILVLIAFVGCKSEPDVVESISVTDEDKAYNVSEDNVEMNAAMREAARNYPLFERAMQLPDTSLSNFTVKMRFKYGDNNTEHMWISDLHLVGGQLFGLLNTEPLHVEGVKVGDTIRVIRDDISDWFYTKNGKLEGGYTIKVIYKYLNEKDKKEFRESWPFEIE
jgi:uncharacterized protein YegJ (DUF2314 family)